MSPNPAAACTCDVNSVWWRQKRSGSGGGEIISLLEKFILHLLIPPWIRCSWPHPSGGQTRISAVAEVKLFSSDFPSLLFHHHFSLSLTARKFISSSLNRSSSFAYFHLGPSIHIEFSSATTESICGIKEFACARDGGNKQGENFIKIQIYLNY